MSTKDDFDKAKDDFDKAATAWGDINDALRAMQDCMARAQCDPPHPAMIACFDALRDAFSQASDDYVAMERVLLRLGR